MSIEKLELVDITCYIEDLNNVLQKCYTSKCFHIELPVHNNGDNFVVLNEDNPYSEPLERLNTLFSKIGFTPRNSDLSKIEDISPEELKKIVSDYEGKFLGLKAKISALEENLTLRKQVATQLEHLEGIDADYERIFSCDSVRVRFGKLPVESYAKLAYHADKPFIFNYYDNDGEYYWGVYFAPRKLKDTIDDMFKNLYFERIRIPEFVHGSGKDAAKDNVKAIAAEREELKHLKKEFSELLENNEKKINELYSDLKYLERIFSLRRNAAMYNDKYVIVTGYIPERQAKGFSALFKEFETVSVAVRPCDWDEKKIPPTKLKNNWFAEPFSMFVEMYGLPSGNGFDPTMLVAVTYTLLFGLMFADLGQGIVIAIFGALLWKFKKNKLGAILARVGVSSAVFGFVFGSVFGFEHLLDPVFRKMGFAEKPFEVMDNINTILYGAIALGILFIIVTILVNIGIGFKQKNYERALFSNNGIAGLVFFASVVWLLVGGVLLKYNVATPAYIICLIVIPALLMFFREPLGAFMMHRKPEHFSVGDFIASNFFEVFEFALSFATNTLSFVRVGGFILSHAGMMSVVMLLSEMASSSGSVVVIILGNIFVIGMEGLIVGIQSLRLEFYEIFSRFYEGEGRPFTPINVMSETSDEK